MGGLYAAAAGIGGDIGGQFLGSHLANAQMKRQYQFTKRLRRSAYQDTVFSLKEAGLNPILAAQQGPIGGGSISMGDRSGPALGTNAMATAKEFAKLKPEIEKTKMGAEQAHSASELAKQQAVNAQLQEQLITEQTRNTESDTAKKDQETATGMAQQELYKQEAIRQGASAKEIEENLLKIQLENAKRQVEYDFYKSNIGQRAYRVDLQRHHELGDDPSVTGLGARAAAAALDALRQGKPAKKQPNNKQNPLWRGFKEFMNETGGPGRPRKGLQAKRKKK